ncbi:hypothetical protein [uncultured Nocardioides sp.]|nr:hypothetical protein [uncultured Nocardioides sp.]
MTDRELRLRWVRVPGSSSSGAFPATRRCRWPAEGFASLRRAGAGVGRRGPSQHEPFDLGSAATAWHWLDPAVRHRRAWELLPYDADRYIG